MVGKLGKSGRRLAWSRKAAGMKAAETAMGKCSFDGPVEATVFGRMAPAVAMLEAIVFVRMALEATVFGRMARLVAMLVATVFGRMALVATVVGRRASVGVEILFGRIVCVVVADFVASLVVCHKADWQLMTN